MYGAMPVSNMAAFKKASCQVMGQKYLNPIMPLPNETIKMINPNKSPLAMGESFIIVLTFNLNFYST